MPQPSYVHGASATPLIGETIGVRFNRIAERFAERDALIVRHQQVRWSYRELQRRVDAFAAGLLALGLEAGERVGIWSPNNAEWVVAQLAEQVRLLGTDNRRTFQDQRLYRDAEPTRARAGRRRSG